MKKLLQTFILVIAVSASAVAQVPAKQTKFTISGIITDKKTGETLIGTTVRVKELPNTGTASNAYGFYSITLPTGNYTIIYSYISYREQVKKVSLTQDFKTDIAMEDNTALLEEAIVTAERKDHNVTGTQIGMEKLDTREISKIPVLFGEQDILKTIQLMPGIKGAGEGNAGFYVRGGGADQNLILLDEAPVYNASHLLGFFSTFNSDAIKDVTIHKGGMPSQYGGRLSSVLDIKMNEGNNQSYHVSGGLGLISSKLNIEGPIQKDKSSFLITARRTYADIFLKLSSDESQRNSKLYFYDINAKMNYTLGRKDHLFLSGYFGRDVLNSGAIFGIDWGNITGTARWNHIVNDKLFSNTSLICSNYDYKISFKNGANDLAVTSKINDWNFKQEFQFYPNPKNQIRIGFNSIYHTIKPGEITASETSSVNPQKIENRLAWENAVYFSNEWTATTKISVIYGLRLSSFSALGKGTFYSFDDEGKVSDTTTYSSGEFVKTYFTPEPRISASYKLNAVSSVKLGYARNIQNLHLISNSTSASPTDLWIPSSKNVKPEISDQVSLGYFRNFQENKYEFSAEVYYKAMQNQIDYRNGANTGASEKIEGELLFGKGRAYGLEVFLKKKYGKLNGWIGYTLSRTEKSIDGINDGNWYAAKQDITHDISIVGIYDLNEKWSLSATWVYSTGKAVTFPSGKYTLDGQVQFLYTERNGYRTPAYHRLDLGATWYAKKTAKFESSWNFSLYNAYGRENAYSISFRQDPDNAAKTQAVQTTLFRWIPSITYNFKF
ncbi:MAG: TonB-dependent receptor [Bacteroidia bacterium]